LTCVVTFIVSSMNSSIAGMKDILRLRCVVRQKSTGVRRGLFLSMPL
jgi:molybdate-binding protein